MPSCLNLLKSITKLNEYSETDRYLAMFIKQFLSNYRC
ncbi:hypothetical protein YPPY13_0841 [Yersinia pestis PY-13]|uniref:Uncharacterized protein n=2 Tax=Yersinia pestis TaxID=632 RepID=A0AAV3B5U7_YERPE|nr:hypothetical protein YPIP275_0100 [Yersinia pestis biovar Orientalis str. IP275]EDR44599.1 hypothetical protein YpE1979001_2923 [Yersinia pestis biovar Antiqua str. E1979001]EDR51275.1 hypothetical protein YpB42003004_4406 [Yersinia pestis biovar Antiqua str. B42003004]EDR65759.1 hypothetical protein YpK1973002_0626 [Yersinia pestis biovar Mediaevalis str. K1973002]EIQ94177.1 hypothetical protein YPPY02_0787 [Yersinia pestis PY-02]EIQ96475.1 hypothetical protein YPPY03_0824 [Yersinia pestis